MSNINWNKGQLTTLKPGDTATCQGGLTQNQLYCLVFYNAAQNQTDTTVSVVWSNSGKPIMVDVPGVTGNQGLAALCFVNGNDTNTVSAAITQAQDGEIQAYIASVSMPEDTTGINNVNLPLDGTVNSFAKFTRFYSVPASHWYNLTLQSDINQFICVGMGQDYANVWVLNSLVHPSTQIYYAGNTSTQVEVKAVKKQTYTDSFQGNGQQYVFVNADSVQNSQSATIAAQSLSGLYKAH